MDQNSCVFLPPLRGIFPSVATLRTLEIQTSPALLVGMSIVALSDKVSACVTGDRVELFVTNFSGKITMLLEPGVVPAGASSIPAATAAKQLPLRTYMPQEEVVHVFCCGAVSFPAGAS